MKKLFALCLTLMLLLGNVAMAQTVAFNDPAAVQP